MDISFIIALLAGLATGILSAFGIGGGTLLLLWMTLFAGVEQHTAQGINLLYFLPTAAIALPAHIKNGFIDKKNCFTCHCCRADWHRVGRMGCHSTGCTIIAPLLRRLSAPDRNSGTV